MRGAARNIAKWQVGLLLKGLIGGARKNGWQLAEYAGDPAVWRMYRILTFLTLQGAAIRVEWSL
jgi:hypothetical protein